MAGAQDQRSSKIYSKLTKGRSKTNLRNAPTSAKDAGKGSLDSVPASLTLELPKGFGGDEGHDLQGEEGISQYMSKTRTHNVGAAPQAKSSDRDADAAGTANSVSRTFDIAEFTARHSVETTTVAELQSRLLQEMKEKGELISKYESLSAQHMGLQKEVAASRTRAGSVSTLPSAAAGVVAGVGTVEATRSVVRDGTFSSDMAAGSPDIERIRSHTVAPSIAGSTQTATVDDVFREEMDRCAASVESWVATSWAKETLDFEKAAQKAKDGEAAHQQNGTDGGGAVNAAADGAALDRNSRRDVLAEIANIVGPNYRNIAERSKTAFLLALVAARLMEIFDDDFFFGLPSSDDGSDLAAARQAYRLLHASGSEAGAAADVNAWRAHTAILLRKLADSAAELRTHTQQLVFGLSTSIDMLLASVTSAGPSEARREQLRAIVARVVELARLFRAQLAAFAFALPAVAKGDVVFDRAAMLADGEGGPISVVKKVVLATWPSVARVADEHGRPVAPPALLCKARVVCADG